MPHPLFRPRILVPVAVVAAIAVAVPATLSATAVGNVRIDGVTDGALLDAAGAKSLSVSVDAAGAPASKISVTLDGKAVPLTDGTVALPRPLSDGAHTLDVVVGRPLGLPGTSQTRAFTVDSTPPALSVGKLPKAAGLREPVTLTGTVEKGATLSVDGGKVTVAGATWSASFPTPPADVRLVARDAAGNESAQTLTVGVRRPSDRAVHMTALAWGASVLRQPILDLIKAKKIDAVEVDIKDEDGIVGYRSTVPLANEIGATTSYYDAKKMLDELHGMNVKVIGRIVAFRDPKLAQWAFANGHKDWVIQTPAGEAYKGRYGDFAFTNFANAEVRKYNVDLAKEAGDLGFDDILYDYVRRPDGKLSSMVFPGLTGTAEISVASFLGEARQVLRPEGVYLGASVFGIAATRPLEIAQDIKEMAKYVDYVAPMVYPSHWGPGEYGVATPNAAPYAIVKASLADFQKAIAGTDVMLQPWLQDFSLGAPKYGPAEVRAQITASSDLGINGFLLWNAGARYTGAALDPVN